MVLGKIMDFNESIGFCEFFVCCCSKNMFFLVKTYFLVKTCFFLVKTCFFGENIVLGANMVLGVKMVFGENMFFGENIFFDQNMALVETWFGENIVFCVCAKTCFFNGNMVLLKHCFW